MDIVFNDLSLDSDKSIFENWENIVKFNELINKIASVNNISILTTDNLWLIPISGYDIYSNKTCEGISMSQDRVNLLKLVYSKFSPNIKNGFPYFYIDKKRKSAAMGLAAEKSMISVSMTFNEDFKKDIIEGLIDIDNNKTEEKGTIKNIYKDKTDNYILITDITECRGKNPLAEPMWNQKFNENYLKDIDFVKQDAKARQGMLIKYGKIIAEMNGWYYNERVSKLNSNSGQLRYIFDSSFSFVNYPIAYISIDMEGPDLAFELCDKKGKHQGECNWKGEIKVPQKNHDIIVK